MKTEYIFTPEQQLILDEIEESRLMAMEPFERAAIEFNAGCIRPPLWKLAEMQREMVAVSMMFAQLRAKVYALVMPRITMTQEEYRSSTLYKKEEANP